MVGLQTKYDRGPNLLVALESSLASMRVMMTIKIIITLFTVGRYLQMR